MSGAVVTSIATAVGSAVVGSIVQSAMAPDTPSQSASAPPTPTAPPQASQSPDATSVRQSNTQGGAGQGGGGGPGSTLLTGAQGVDPNKLSLGTSLLTGGVDKKLGS